MPAGSDIIQVSKPEGVTRWTAEPSDHPAYYKHDQVQGQVPSEKVNCNAMVLHRMLSLRSLRVILVFFK